MPDPCQLVSLCHRTRSRGVSCRPPLIHFHQWLLHSLNGGELPHLLEKECELNSREEKYFSHFARKYLGCVAWKPFLLEPLKFARNNEIFILRDGRMSAAH